MARGEGERRGYPVSQLSPRLVNLAPSRLRVFLHIGLILCVDRMPYPVPCVSRLCEESRCVCGAMKKTDEIVSMAVSGCQFVSRRCKQSNQ